MSRTPLTHDVFAARAIKRHNAKYTYQNRDYRGMAFPVTITCPIHGDFRQLALNHLAGTGCPQCSTRRPRLSRTTPSAEADGRGYSRRLPVVDRPNGPPGGMSEEERDFSDRVSAVLTDYGIEHTRNHRPLPFDSSIRFSFYLPLHRVFIDLQPRHHFEAGADFDSQWLLEYSKAQDQVKARVAAGTRTHLVLLTYKDFKTKGASLEELLLDRIRSAIVPVPRHYREENRSRSMH